MSDTQEVTGSQQKLKDEPGTNPSKFTLLFKNEFKKCLCSWNNKIVYLALKISWFFSKSAFHMNIFYCLNTWKERIGTH